MKIVLINTLYVPTLMGGAERVVQDVAEGLAGVGHQVVIVSTTSGRDTRTDWINGVKVYYVGLKNLYWPYGNTEHHRACKSLWHAVDSYNPWMSREIERILSLRFNSTAGMECAKSSVSA